MSTDPESTPHAAVHGIVSEGDAACWLGELCPECGAMPEGAGAGDPAVPCWRCGDVRCRTMEEEGATSAKDDGASDGAGQCCDGSEHGTDAPGA